MREETIDSIIDQPLVFQESTENFLEVLDDAPTLFLEPEESYSEDEFQINPIFPQSDWEDSLKNSSKEDSLFEDPEMSDCSILSNWDDENCGAMHPTMSFNDSIF